MGSSYTGFGSRGGSWFSIRTDDEKSLESVRRLLERLTDPKHSIVLGFNHAVAPACLLLQFRPAKDGHASAGGMDGSSLIQLTDRLRNAGAPNAKCLA